MNDSTNEAPVVRSGFTRRMDLIRAAYLTHIDEPCARLTNDQCVVIAQIINVVRDLSLEGICEQFCKQLEQELLYHGEARTKLATMDIDERRELMQRRISHCDDFEKAVRSFVIGEQAQD